MLLHIFNHYDVPWYVKTIENVYASDVKFFEVYTYLLSQLQFQVFTRLSYYNYLKKYSLLTPEDMGFVTTSSANECPSRNEIFSSAKGAEEILPQAYG